MRSSWKKVVLILAGAAALLFSASYFFPAAYEICNWNQVGHANCASYHFGPYGIALVTRTLQNHSELITALATAFLAAITFMLVGLGRDQGNTARAQLRAYVFVDSASMFDGSTWPQAPNPVLVGCPNAAIVIKNFGQTPAFNVRHYSALIATSVNADGTLPANALSYPVSMAGLNPTSIGPEAATHLARNLGRAITPYEINILANPSFALIVFGRIEYDDAFGTARRTDYCLGYSGAYPPPQGTILVFMADGNRAT